MPYASAAELPKSVRDQYSPDCQKVFMRVLNTALYANKKESESFAMAHAAAKNCSSSK